MPATNKVDPSIGDASTPRRLDASMDRWKTRMRKIVSGSTGGQSLTHTGRKFAACLFHTNLIGKDDPVSLGQGEPHGE